MSESKNGFHPEAFVAHLDYRGPKFGGQWEVLTEKLNKARQQQDALDVLSAELALQNFVGQHDNAGAYKTEQFGSDLSARLDARPDALETDAQGYLKTTAEDAEQHFLLFSVTELDRVNDEGTHTAGNIALAKSVQTVEGVVRQVLLNAGVEASALDDSYDLYRLRGSDFMLRLRLPAENQTSNHHINEIKETISGQSIEVVSGKDPVPLTAVVLSQAEAMTLFNRVQDCLPKDQQIKGKDIKRTLIEIIKRSSEFSSEVQRLQSQLTRAINKKQQGAKDGRSFFDRYIAKSFIGTAFASWDQLDITSNTLQEEVRETATQIVSASFARERQTANETEAVLLEAIATQPHLSIPAPALAVTEQAKLSAYKTLKAQDLAVRQARTHGNDEHQAFRRQLEAVKGDPSNTERLCALVERYGDIPDTIAVDYERSEQRQKVLAIVEQRFQHQEQSTDTLTGLGNRGTYYAEMRKRHQEAVITGAQVQVFFIDMAFLKYFNQQGGREVGNYALQTAAELLESTIENLALPRAQVFRYAGDEFTIIFEGTENDRQNLNQAIHMARHRRGAIERSDASSHVYLPEALQFNFGSADRGLALEAMQTLIDKGDVAADLQTTNPEAYLHQLIDMQTRLADMGGEADKSFSRILFLMDRLRQPVEPGSLEETQIASLIHYSQKAIFGLDATALRDLDQRIIAGETTLRSFLNKRLKQKTAERATGQKILDQVIENFAREQHARWSIAELKKKGESSKALAEAEQSLEEILVARTNIARQVIPINTV